MLLSTAVPAELALAEEGYSQPWTNLRITGALADGAQDAMATRNLIGGEGPIQAVQVGSYTIRKSTIR